MQNLAEEIVDARATEERMADDVKDTLTSDIHDAHIPTLIDRFMRENVSIDPNAEIIYDSDQAYVCCPRRFATVGFEIYAGYGLQLIVDRLRKDLGFQTA